jgi:predicted nucleic acid-binding protein
MSRVYLDTNILIYWFDKNPEFGAQAAKVIQRIAGGEHVLCSSLFVVGEVSIAPLKNRDEFTLAAFNRFFRSESVLLLPYPPEAVPIYASLRAHHRVRPLDALHLASAAHADVDLFLTNDASLIGLPIPGIGAVGGLDATF